MKPCLITLGLLLGILRLSYPQAAFADSAKELETRALLRLLDEMVDMKEFQSQDGISFKGALDLLAEKFAAKGKELRIQINNQAFKKGTTARSIVDGELPIRLSSTPRRLSVEAILRLILDQEDLDATFLIRNAMVEILPAKQAAPAVLLQTKVAAAFDRLPLEEVLQELSFQTGASVVLDTRAGEMAKTPITATFRNDVTLKAALCMVSEMAKLKMVEVPGGLFITTPAHADCLQKERAAPSGRQGKKSDNGVEKLK
jgi:hypothetical protein